MTRKITVTILTLAVLAAGLLGLMQRREERVASATFSDSSAVIVVAGEFPWQRGH
jgi:hypothetical protein